MGGELPGATGESDISSLLFPRTPEAALSLPSTSVQFPVQCHLHLELLYLQQWQLVENFSHHPCHPPCHPVRWARVVSAETAWSPAWTAVPFRIQPKALSTLKPASLWLTFLVRSRRDGRSANGTLTLRRSSTTPLGQASHPTPSSENAAQQPISVDTASLQLSNYEPGSARYSKEDLLGMFRSQRAADDPSRLFISGWDPTQVNGGNVRGWGKTNNNHVPQEPEVCWDQNGDTAPMGLHDFSVEEKEVSFHLRTKHTTRSTSFCR